MKLNYNKNTLAELKQNYFATKALYEIIDEKAKRIQEGILLSHSFYADKESGEVKRILRPFDTYLMSETDFDLYLVLVYAEYQKAGIADKRGKDYMAGCCERDLYNEAEKRLINYAIEIIPESNAKGKEYKNTLREAEKNIKYKDKVLDLILSLEC